VWGRPGTLLASLQVPPRESHGCSKVASGTRVILFITYPTDEERTPVELRLNVVQSL
jgi:hypothetical protein